MGLDVEPPNPPDLTNRPMPPELETSDAVDSSTALRRAELEEILDEGAWVEAFNEWAAYTDLTEDEFHTVANTGLFQQLDFYWDPASEQLEFTVPALPADLTSRDDLTNRLAAELSDLCQTVVETIEEVYVDWTSDEAGEDTWSEEMFEEEQPMED